MLFQLDPDQIKTVEYGIRNPYSIFALEMGVGKTACALGVWEQVKGTCLVICPSYLILNWRNEIRKFLGPGILLSVITKGDQIYKLWDTDIAIISYELAQKAEYFFKWADTIVIDEATYLKSMKATRTDTIHKFIYEYSKKRVHLLTGTPIKNRVEEFYSLIALCHYNPKKPKNDFLERFPDSVTFADYFSFRREYEMDIKNRRMTIVKWEGVQREEELKSYLKGIYIRFKSTQEKPVHKDIQVSDVADLELLAEYQAWAEENTSVRPEYKVASALKKVPFTAKYVTDLIDEVGNVVVFTDHVDSCIALAKALNTTPITGQTTVVARQRIADEFQAGTRDRVVATIGSFSTGYNLSAAWNLVFNDYPWVPGDIQQAMFRIMRRGQTKRCVVHRVFGSPQDAYIMKTILEKQTTIEKVI